MRRKYYYKDLLNDDFAQNNIKQKKIPSNYQYITYNPFRKAFDFFLHHIIATPVAFLFQKIFFGEKIVNRKVIKPYLKTGLYLYGNHTRSAGDAFTPNIITFPRKSYILINPDGVSIPFVRHIVKSLGGIPVPNDISGIRNYHESLLKISKNNCITIYPEAHIWPLYTKIRPFKEFSFRYPVEAGKPVFAFTVTYQKRRLISFPKTTVYVDGPFFSDESLSIKENQRMLRDEVYSVMEKRSKNSNCNYHEYINKQD